MYFKYFKNQDKHQFFIENDKSERFTGVVAELSPSGGSPQRVADEIYKKWLLPQKYLPWTRDLNTFYAYSSPRPMAQKYLDIALEDKVNWTFNHDFVKTNYGKWITRIFKGIFNNKLSASYQDLIIQALETSPLCASVFAWRIGSDGLAYKLSIDDDNHWAVIVDYEYGKYWLVYDNYLNCWVKLRWDYNFGFIKRYTLKKTSDEEVINITNQKNMEDGKKLYNQLNGKYIIRAEKSGELYLVGNNELKYCAIYIGNQELRNEFNEFLRKKSNFIGVSESSWNKLSLYINSVGGSIEEPINIEKLLKNN